MSPLPVIILGLSWPIALTGPTPGYLALLLLGITALCLVVLQKIRMGRLLALGLGVSAIAAWHVQHGLQQRLGGPFAQSPITGQVVSLPYRPGDRVSFVFDAQSGPWGAGERRIEVRWTDPPVSPRVGEYWQLPMRLTPPRSRLNFSGPDRERTWFAGRIHGLGTVKGDASRRLAAARGHPVGRWRETVKDRLLARLGGLPGTGLVLALGIGDRSQLSPELREAMRGTGTGHLLAISGLHVGLVAMFGFWLSRLVLGLAGWRSGLWPAQRLAVVPGLLAALVYAALAGFGTSPRRALIMLSVAAFAFLLRRKTDPWQAWGIALAVVLLLDPLAILQAGFWLSFGAVAVLLYQFQGRQPLPGRVGALIRAQVAVGVVLLPLVLGWFQWATLSAFVVNLLAIPWVSLITLPLVLLALLGLPSDSLAAELVASMAERSADWLETALVVVSSQLEALAWRTRRPSPLALILALLGGILILLPAAFAVRRFGLVLLLPLLLPAGNDLSDGEFRLELLDVGQGQAAFLQTQHRLALIDSGPGLPGQWDLAQSVILPAARQLRRRPPDLLLVSHGDLDHAGGWRTLQRAWSGTALLGSLPERAENMAACNTQRRWQWDGVEFEVLHPGRWLPYRGNDSSCVLAVTSASGSVLLPGDISHLVERRLAFEERPPFDLVLAPHHGSKSSSSETFLNWAQPQSAWAATGFGNRFVFPHAEVVNRYESWRVPLATTAACGAMRVTFREDGSRQAASARRVRPAFWRWSAARQCP